MKTHISLAAALLAALPVVSITTISYVAVAEEPSIRSKSDYEKHGFPKLGNSFWTVEENLAALKAAETLAEADPKLLPSWGDRISRDFFSRMTNPKHLDKLGPTGGEYFAALEQLYLKYGTSDQTRFDRDFPKIQAARLHFALSKLKSRPNDNKAIADAVFGSLMAWSRTRFDLKSQYSETFHRNLRDSDSHVVFILKRMPPEFHERVLLKLDAIADAYPEAATKQKITPDFMEKLLKSVSVRPEKLKFQMLAAEEPDLKKAWQLTELKIAVDWLRRQGEIDKTKLPRADSAFLKKMLSPDTLKSVVRAEGDVLQLASTLATARSQYLGAFQTYRNAGLKDYVPEAAPLQRAFYDLWWVDMQRFEAWKRKTSSGEDDLVAKQFNNTAVTFCTWTINDAAFARENLGSKYTAEFQAFAVEHYPQAFRMMSEESRARAAEYFFKYKAGTEQLLKFAGGSTKQGLLAQKKMVDQLETAIRPLIPKGVPGDPLDD